MTAPSSFPLVLRQTPTMGRWLLPLGAVGLLPGLWFLVLEQGLAVIAVPLLLVAGLCLLLGAAMLWRPAQLTLSSAGLQVETFILRRGRLWPWRHVSAFTLDKVWASKQRAPFTCFTTTEAGQPQQQVVPAYWEKPAQETLDLLNQARAKWGKRP